MGFISRRAIVVRCCIPFLGSALLVAACGWLPERSVAQKPAGARDEQRELTPPKLKPPLHIEDDEPSTAPTRTFGSRPVDLRREAELAKNPAAKLLFSRLAQPHDEIRLKPASNVREIEPIAVYVGAAPKEGKLTLRWADRSRPREPFDVAARDIEHINYYEAIAVAEVERFFESIKSGQGLPRLEALETAEKALAEVLRFHETARERGLRKGDDWSGLDRELRAKLLSVRLAQLQALADAKDWTGVLELGNQLVEVYPQNREARAAVVNARAQQIEQTLVADDDRSYIEARKGLEQIERLFPGSQDQPAARRLRDQLQKRATALKRTVEELARKDKAKAAALLRTAEGIWPQLDGLQKLRQELQPYRPLRVGVRYLPENLSPATAATDSERQALELLFESLVRPVPDAAVGQRYEGVLAVGDPRLVPLGRQFQMVRDARWYRPQRGSDDPVAEPVTAADITGTVKGNLDLARSSEWQDILLDAKDQGDPFRVRVSLRQGYLDPLSLMTFKIVPAKYLAGGIADFGFAHDPVGSGPFYHGGTRDGDARSGKSVVFLANPAYGGRSGKTDLPSLREIHFVRSPAPILDFRDGQLHMLLDLPTQQIKELKSPEAGLQNVTVYTLPSRRVWFLAVNHRNQRLQNDNLRRAIAHAIDREKILDDCFRDNFRNDRGQKVHTVLNGPYPAGSWACDPKQPADPYRPDMARPLAKQANAVGQELELLYPSDVPQVADACRAIKAQIETTGIKIKLRGLSGPELYRAVAVDHQYDLAYYHWDHIGDSYWLWPLFDPQTAGRGGKNVLGPIHDQDLESLFTQLLAHREFTKVQELTRQIHKRLYDRMPLIPLWQLDMHIAIHNDVKTVPAPERLDPLLVFTHVEQWRLAK
jgi:peptide/nickel transport system substrate-binding protein